MPVSTKNIKQFPGVRTVIFKALALRAIARADLCRLGYGLRRHASHQRGAPRRIPHSHHHGKAAEY
jgi:hypothetical protein